MMHYYNVNLQKRMKEELATASGTYLHESLYQRLARPILCLHEMIRRPSPSQLQETALYSNKD